MAPACATKTMADIAGHYTGTATWLWLKKPTLVAIRGTCYHAEDFTPTAVSRGGLPAMASAPEGTWGGRYPRLADYVTVAGLTDG